MSKGKSIDKFFEEKIINWNIINPVDHMNAPEDVSSTDKSLRFTDNVTDKNDLSSPENEKNQKNCDFL